MHPWSSCFRDVEITCCKPNTSLEGLAPLPIKQVNQLGMQQHQSAQKCAIRDSDSGFIQVQGWLVNATIVGNEMPALGQK